MPELSHAPPVGVDTLPAAAGRGHNPLFMNKPPPIPPCLLLTLTTLFRAGVRLNIRRAT
jgi:hypothetical protein